MTTLRDLQYVIDANTQGLHSALPTIQKLTSTLERLDNSVKALGNNSQKGFQQTGNAASGAARSVQQSSQQIKQAMIRNEAAMISASAKVKQFNADIRESGAPPRLLANTTRAYNTLEKVLKNSSSSTAEITRAKARFNASLSTVRRELQNYGAAQRAAAQSTKTNEAQMLRQSNAVERTRIKFLDLQNALHLMGAKDDRVEALTRSFTDFEQKLQSGTLSAQEFAEAQNQINAEMAAIKRNEGFTDLSKNMTDLAKSVQVALGPLSGVAARITAITSLANRNTIAFAAMVGGIIAFGTSMVKAIQVGASYERQMHRINSIIDITGNRIGMTGREVDEISRRVAQATMTSQGAVRDASAALLTIRGVNKEIFEGALLAAQGLSQIGRGDIQSQVRRIARILEDPANNLKALTESGVYFNAVEERRIHLLQMSGRIDEARATVMERLTEVQNAATAETLGLSGAWDSFKETFTDFVQDASVGSGAVSAITAMVKDMTQGLRDFNLSVGASVNLGKAYRMVAVSLGTAFKLIAENINLVVAAIGILISLKLAAWLIGAAMAAWKFVRVLRTMGIFAAGATAGLKGLAIAAAAWGAIELYESFNEDTNSLENLMKKMNELGDSFKKNVSVADEHADRLQRAMQKLNEQIQTANLQGDVTEAEKKMGVLQEAIDNVNAGNIKEATEILEQHLKIASRTAGQAAKEYDEIASSLEKLSEEHMSVVREQEEMEAQLKNLRDNWDTMRQVLLDSGHTFGEAEAHLRRLRTEITLNSNSVKAFINQQEIAVNTARRELVIANSLGSTKRKLQIEQRIINDLYQSGIITSSNYLEALRQMRVLGLGPLIDSIRETSKELERLGTETEIATMRAEMQNSIDLMKEEINLVGASHRERAAGLDTLRMKQRLLNMGLDEGNAAFREMIALTQQLAELDLAKGHAESMKAMREQAKAQERTLRTMFYSERTRNRIIALDEKKIELAEKYGDIMDEMAQKELNMFKLLQERDEAIRKWQEFADVAERAFRGLEDAIVDFIKTGELNWERFVSSILEDIFRITYRALITRPLQDMLGNLMGGVTGGDEGAGFGGIFGGALDIGTAGNPAYVIPLGSGLGGEGFFGDQPIGGLLRPGFGQEGAGGVGAMAEGTNDVVRQALQPIQDLGNNAADTANKVLNMGNGVQMTTDAFDRSLELTAREAERVGEASAEQAEKALRSSLSSEQMSTSSGTASAALEQLAQAAGQASAGLGGAGGAGGGLANLEFVNQGAVRNMGLTDTLQQKIKQAVGAVFGQGSTAQVYSGGQPALGSGLARVGSTRHDLGKAADLRVFDQFGNQMTGDQLNPLVQYWQAQGWGGTGVEMRGGGIHLDEHAGRAPFWTYGQHTQGQIDAARLGQQGIMPQGQQGMTSFMPQQMEVPQMRPDMPQMPQTPQMGPGLGQTPLPSFDELSQGVNDATSSFTQLNDQLPDLTSNLTSGLDKAADSASDLADNGLNRAASGMERLADDTLVQSVQSQVQATAQTTQMGTQATVTSAQVQQLGSAAMQAAAQMQMGGMGGMFFHGGGVVGTGGTPGIVGGSFAGAPRLHGGLHPDEFRAILKKDEAVFTPDQLDVLGEAIFNAERADKHDGARQGGGNSFRDVNVHLHGIKDFDSFKKSEAQVNAGLHRGIHRAMSKQG